MVMLDTIFKTILGYLQNDDDIMFSVLLSILGIVITIFTVVYSFMETTSQKITVLELENRNALESNPVRSSSLKFSKRYFRILKKFNTQLKYLIFINIILLLLYGVFSLCWNCIWSHVIYNCLSILYILYSFMVLLIYIKDYENRY